MNDLLNDLLNESVLRDGQIGYYCWTWWNVSVRATTEQQRNQRNQRNYTVDERRDW
jgi:hypothetical protein